MISRYKQVDIDDVTAGMVLAADVLDHQGSVLLPAGVPLTDAHLTSMRRRSIDSVRIADDAVSDADLAQERERVSARVAQLFRRSGPGAADAMLKAELSAYRMENLR